MAACRLSGAWHRALTVLDMALSDGHLPRNKSHGGHGSVCVDLCRSGIQKFAGLQRIIACKFHCHAWFCPWKRLDHDVSESTAVNSGRFKTDPTCHRGYFHNDIVVRS